MITVVVLLWTIMIRILVWCGLCICPECGGYGYMIRCIHGPNALEYIRHYCGNCRGDGIYSKLPGIRNLPKVVQPRRGENHE